jgi:hypothetical protein
MPASWSIQALNIWQLNMLIWHLPLIATFAQLAAICGTVTLVEVDLYNVLAPAVIAELEREFAPLSHYERHDYV